MEKPHKFRLFLYIVGQASRSEKIIKNLNQILESKFNKNYFLEIINIIDNPELAEHDKVLATPTLIKTHPPPVKRIIGDFNNKELVLSALDLIKKK